MQLAPFNQRRGLVVRSNALWPIRLIGVGGFWCLKLNNFKWSIYIHWIRVDVFITASLPVFAKSDHVSFCCLIWFLISYDLQARVSSVLGAQNSLCILTVVLKMNVAPALRSL